MRVCIQKSTGRILEMQSAATAGTLIANAVAAGYVAADLEESVVTRGQYAALTAQPWSPAATLSKLREARELVLNRLAGIGFAASVAGDSITVNACLTARLSLLAMTTLPAVANATDEASLRTALLTAYMGIVAAAPPNLVSAFAQFNL